MVVALITMYTLGVAYMGAAGLLLTRDLLRLEKARKGVP